MSKYETFKDLPLGATVLVGGVLVTKTSNTQANEVFGLCNVELNPSSKVELLKSVQITGKQGSKIKLKY